jgi:hypothetical protein
MIPDVVRLYGLAIRHRNSLPNPSDVVSFRIRLEQTYQSRSIIKALLVLTSGTTSVSCLSYFWHNECIISKECMALPEFIIMIAIYEYWFNWFGIFRQHIGIWLHRTYGRTPTDTVPVYDLANRQWQYNIMCLIRIRMFWWRRIVFSKNCANIPCFTIFLFDII